jgi:hypothetical protein
VEAISRLEAPMAREELLGRYMYIFQPHAASELVRAWMVDQRLRGVLGSIVGAHLPGWDGGYKCMQSMFVLRKPGAPGSPWHQVRATVHSLSCSKSLSLSLSLSLCVCVVGA